MTPGQIARNFPKVVNWATKMEQVCLAAGQPLADLNRKDAEAIGIRQLDKVRIVISPQLPLPTDPELRHLTAQFQLIQGRTTGMIFGHGIALKEGKYDRRLIAHELVHVLQHERLGGIERFLRAYIREAFYPPYYPNGPLELEAERVALRVCANTYEEKAEG